jgi:hypothetical protein
VADADIGWAHADALAVLLEPLPYVLFIGDVTAPDDALRYPYLVLWPPPANRQTVTLNGYGGEATTTTQITAAGRSIREVLAALDRVGTRLHRRRPTIPGRACGLIRQEPGDTAPPQKDQAASTPEQPIFFAFLHFTLHSTATAPTVVNP